MSKKSLTQILMTSLQTMISTSESGIAEIAGILVIKLEGLWTFIPEYNDLYSMLTEKVKFKILIPVIRLPEKSQKECSLTVH